jgi:hypothetical protein
MIPDTLKNAIGKIEEYERERSEVYGAWSEEIALAKKVMAAVVELHQQPSPEHHLNFADILSPDQKTLWRDTCEAEINRWTRLLRSLEPVVADTIAARLDDAVQRQDALMEDRYRLARHEGAGT